MVYCSRGSEPWDNGANKWDQLKSQAIAKFIPTIGQFILLGLRSHMIKMYNHDGKPQVVGRALVARACFSTKASKQITIEGCNE